MKAAAQWVRPPSAFLGGAEWGARDHLLAFAYQLHQGMVCPVCKGNVFECRNEDNAGMFETLDTTCHRQAAIEERIGQAGFKPEPGQLFYAAPIDEELVAGSGLTLPAHPNSDEQGYEAGERGEAAEAH